MKLNKETASVLIPDRIPVDSALERVTHLGIGAHSDDLEIMAYHGIAECLHRSDRWFGGITCTDGAGAPRSGPYAHLSDAELRELRRKEQENAARIGHYGVMIQLDYPTSEAKSRRSPLRDDLVWLVGRMRPDYIYTHNLADKHPTHIAITLAVIDAVRRLPRENRPSALYGCEVWRGLDWMLDEEKVSLDVSAYPSLAEALVGVFDSQISGGKRYDLATRGRRQANATYFQARESDQASQLSLALDLTPLIENEQLDPADYVKGFLDRFRADVLEQIRRLQVEG